MPPATPGKPQKSAIFRRGFNDWLAANFAGNAFDEGTKHSLKKRKRRDRDVFPELVAQRIRRFAKIRGPERGIVGADCGFDGRTYPQIAWAKLTSLVEGAALASKHD